MLSCRRVTGLKNASCWREPSPQASAEHNAWNNLGIDEKLQDHQRVYVEEHPDMDFAKRQETLSPVECLEIKHDPWVSSVIMPFFVPENISNLSLILVL